MVAEDAHQRDHAPVALDDRQRAATGSVRRRRREEDEVAAERTGGQAVLAAGVPDPDHDPLPLRRRVPRRLQPARQPGPAARGVDDQVSLEPLLRAPVGAADHLGCHHPATIGCRHQTDHVRGFQEPHAGAGRHPAADDRLQGRPAHADGGQAGRPPAEGGSAEAEPGVGEHVPHPRPGADQLGGDPREELFEDVVATGEKPMEVARLRGATARPGSAEGVAVHDHDLGMGLGQHPRGEQSRDAPAEHDRPVSVGPRHGSLSLVRVWVSAARLPRAAGRSPGQVVPTAAHPVPMLLTRCPARAPTTGPPRPPARGGGGGGRC